MHILPGLFMLAWLSVVPVGLACAEAATEHTATIAVDGLSCPFCAYGLEKNLKKLKGIETVDINMKTGKVTVMIRPDADVDDRALRQAVRKAGFTARDITRR